MTFTTKSTEETEELGFRFGSTLKRGDVVSLRGSLGAGKTVLAKGIAKSLGITEAVAPPTFTPVQEYDGREKLYHLDIYTPTGEDALESMGGEDSLSPDGITLIEWSEKIESMLPDETIYVNIIINDDLSRTITITGDEENEHSFA